MKTKNIIFDWSGTLCDNLSPYLWVLEKMFNELGREMISLEEMQREYNVPYMLFYNKYFPKLTQEKQRELYHKYVIQAPKADLFSGVKETLELLREKDIKLFVLSHDLYCMLNEEAKREGVHHLFEEFFGETIDKHIDMPKIFKKHKLKKGETLYIGDTVGDVAAAKHNKVRSGGISWGYQNRKVLADSNPDILLDQIEDIFKYI